MLNCNILQTIQRLLQVSECFLFNIESTFCNLYDEVGERILGLLESCKEQGSFIVRSYRMAVLLLLTAASSRRVRRSSDSAAVSQARTNIVRHGCGYRKRENQMIQKYFYKNKITTLPPFECFRITDLYLVSYRAI